LQTETDDVPLALMAFQGRLVAGVGKALRIYDIGKKKLLRKVENKVILIVKFHMTTIYELV
jgi:splicing factor 3B subunit 3